MKSIASLCSILLALGSISDSAISTKHDDPSGLTFQSGSNNQIPSLSFETWSQVQNTPTPQLDHLISKKTASSLETEEVVTPSPSDLKRDFSAALNPNLPLLCSLRNLIKTLVSYGFLARPSFPANHHEPIDLSKYTIWEVLNWTLHHTPKPTFGEHHQLPLHRLAWLANLSQPIQDILSDPNADLTFFAPDNKALTPPSKRGPHHHAPGKHIFAEDPEELQLPEEPDHVFWEALEFAQAESDPHAHASEILETGGDLDKEKKKKIFLHVVELVLKYHISPRKKTIEQLLDRNTLPTALGISHEKSAPRFRVRVGAPPQYVKPGEVALNFFTRIGGLGSRPIITKNGVIYIAHRVPLLPPLSPLSQLFLFPKPFSTLTSAIQKVHLDHALLPHFGNKTLPVATDLPASSSAADGFFSDSDLDQVDERVQGILTNLVQEHEGKLDKRSFTVFAPTNRAFRSLGPHLNAFLFSPFGAHVLRYVLSYHIVPDIIWHSDHIDNVTDFKSVVTRYETQVELPQELESFFSKSGTFKGPKLGIHPHFSGRLHGKVNFTDYSLPTLLGSRKNETLKLTVVEFAHHGGKGPVFRKVLIKPDLPHKRSIHHPKGVIPVIIPDGVAWGGAIHVIPQLIHPPVPAGHEDRKDVRRALELLSHSRIHDEA